VGEVAIDAVLRRGTPLLIGDATNIARDGPMKKQFRTGQSGTTTSQPGESIGHQRGLLRECQAIVEARDGHANGYGNIGLPLVRSLSQAPAASSYALCPPHDQGY
jgi:hypothetical protein